MTVFNDAKRPSSQHLLNTMVNFATVLAQLDLNAREFVETELESIRNKIIADGDGGTAVSGELGIDIDFLVNDMDEYRTMMIAILATLDTHRETRQKWSKIPVF
jgi:hypothetical protein